jgi:hypothetical protein
MATVCMLLGSVLLAASLAYSLTNRTSADSENSRPPEFDTLSILVPTISSFTEEDLPLSVRNPNSHSIRICGCSGKCGPDGCVSGMTPSDFDLAPGETKQVLVHFRSPHRTGPFSQELSIFSAVSPHSPLTEQIVVVRGCSECDEVDSY